MLSEFPAVPAAGRTEEQQSAGHMAAFEWGDESRYCMMQLKASQGRVTSPFFLHIILGRGISLLLIFF
jgi:hypothetical protein